MNEEKLEIYALCCDFNQAVKNNIEAGLLDSQKYLNSLLFSEEFQNELFWDLMYEDEEEEKDPEDVILNTPSIDVNSDKKDIEAAFLQIELTARIISEAFEAATLHESLPDALKNEEAATILESMKATKMAEICLHHT